MLILRRQIQFLFNDVDVADFNKFVDDKRMSVIANFCVSNVINYIIEKLHLNIKIDAKIDFNFDKMSLFMSFMINKILNERNLLVYIKRMTFSIFFFYESVFFNSS